MKIGNVIGLAGLSILLGACIPSVNPFYTEKDVIFEPGLVGEWNTTGDTNNVQTWTFEKSGDNAYKLLINENGQKHGELSAHLFKVKGRFFLDVIPAECKFAPDQSDLVSAAVFPGHLLFRVPQIEPRLQLASCDYDWLAKYLEGHPKALAGHKEDKQCVLTARTKDLQAFVLQHLDELFQKSEELVRKPSK